jgi:hypothetical protein
VDPARIIPPLPPGIPIVPVKAKRRWPVRRIVLLVLVGWVGLGSLRVWIVHNRREAEAKQIAVQQAEAKRNAARSQAGANRGQAGAKRSAADTAKITNTVALAMWMHRPKGTRIPVTLSNGVRFFQIDSSVVSYQAGKPTTCVRFSMIDPKTRAGEAPETLCIPALDYPIEAGKASPRPPT